MARFNRIVLYSILAFTLIFPTLLSAQTTEKTTILPLSGANWAGDINTTGGLDAGLPGDSDTMTVSADYFSGYPAETSMAVILPQDYSRNALVEFTIGYRINSMQAKVSTVLWDGRPICICHANYSSENMREKKVLLNGIDFNFSAGTHTLRIKAEDNPSNEWDLFEVDAIRLRVIDTVHEPFPPQNQQWLIVSGESISEAANANAVKLQQELSAMSTDPVSMVSADTLTESQKNQYNLLVVGDYNTNSLAKQILDSHSLSAPLASDAAFVQQQGYIVAAYPGEFSADKKVLLAAGWDSPGAVYGISHLRTHMQSNLGQLYLDKEGSPDSTSSFYNLYRPDIEERAVYYNIAYGISYGKLTVDNWRESDWEYWVDKQVCAQLTHIHFFLWGDGEFYYPPSPLSYTERNRRVHESLKHMITYAHSRGLKVNYFISTTIIPTDIFNANKTTNPLFKSTSVYADYGFPIVCPANTETVTFGQYSWDNTFELMMDLAANEIEWFKEADGFHIWFYDPGGCWCDSSRHNCKGLQAQRMMEQVTGLTTIMWQKSPDSHITVNMWPVWALEGSAYIGYRYRDTFLDLLKTSFASNMDKITVADDVRHSDTTLIQAQQRDFRLNGFIFSTNVETGYPFVVPMLSYLDSIASISQTRGVDALHFHRNEDGSKYPNSYFTSRFMWDMDADKNDAVQQYVQWIANTNTVAAAELKEAFILLDSFTYNGTASQDNEAKGEQIKTLVESALGLLPVDKQEELEWLLTTARAMALYGVGVENRTDSAKMANLSAQFTTLLQNSPSFSSYAIYTGLTRFTQHVNWIADGWASANF